MMAAGGGGGGARWISNGERHASTPTVIMLIGTGYYRATGVRDPRKYRTGLP